MINKTLLLTNTILQNNQNKVIDAKSSANIDFDIKNNDKDPKFKVGDNMGTSKCSSVLAKFYKQSW